MIGNNQPLADRMRPTKLSDIVGQDHLTSENGILTALIQRGHIPSMVFWGPPGVGKTTLAHVIALETKREFHALNAIDAGVKEVRELLSKTKGGMFKPIVFIDEIHRFNKTQQDALLHAVEKGHITLICATTENPSFEINAALLSRCQVYTLNRMEESSLIKLAKKTIQNDLQLLQRNIIIEETDALIQISNGDARKLLNILELITDVSDDPIRITNSLVTETCKEFVTRYDKAGEQHYDIISAFIKSIRGSDPNAAVYYLARMIKGGEDPAFIARRLLILASEDVGNANPTALILANTCFDAVKKIGWPESRIILSQTTIYLASSPKSNSSYLAIDAALALVEKTGDELVPLNLRNSPTKLMKEMNYGKNYQYAHDFDLNFVNQEYMPEKLAGTKLVEPGKNARENELRKFLKDRWKDKYNY